MVKCCCVRGCRNSDKIRGHGRSYYSIPAVISNHGLDTTHLTTLRRAKWIEATGRNLSEWEPKSHHRICSDHFVSGRPSIVTDVANIDWVPTLKLGSSASAVVIEKKTAKRKPEVAADDVTEPVAKKLKMAAEADQPTSLTVRAQLEDDAEARWQDWVATVHHITEFLKTGFIDSSLSPAKQKEIANMAQTFYIEGGTLFRRKAGKTRKVIIVKEERDAALKASHCGEDGTLHLNVEKMIPAVKLLYLWKGIKKDVADWVNRCTACNPLAAAAASERDSDSLHANKTAAADNNDDDDDDDVVILLNSDEEIMEEELVSETPVMTKPRPPKPVAATQPSPGGAGIMVASQKPKHPPQKMPTLAIKTGGKLNVTLGNKALNAPLKVIGKSTVPGGSLVSGRPVLGPPSSKSTPIYSVNSYANILAKSKGPVPLTILPKKVPADGKTTSAAAGSQSTSSAATGDKTSSPGKVYRPAAWLLHGIGLRMVREVVYEDLISIQEVKATEGQLGDAEQQQLTKLRSAYDDLVAKNKPIKVKPNHVCRCKFAAGSRLELELHQDYGQVIIKEEIGYFRCCFCNYSSRSALLHATHIERTHSRQARIFNLPSPTICPLCPYELRSIGKVKLMRHIERCSLMFRPELNLAPIAVDGDIPLIDLRPPLSTTAAVLPSGSAKSVMNSPQLTKTTPALNTPLVTPSAGSIASVDTTPVQRKRIRPPLPPDGLGFEICEICGAFVKNLDSLVVHMTAAHQLAIVLSKVSGERPPIQCEKCPERFWTPVGVSEHVKQMHKENPDPPPPAITVCPLCKRTRLTDVVEHLTRSHRITLVDMFAQRYCSVCQLALQTARSFEHHMLTHHSELFPDRAALYATIVAVDRATRGRAGVVCRGRQPSVLSGAIRKCVIDLTDTEYTCKVCEAEFSSERKLTAHVENVHRYACSHCPRRFSTAEFLGIHVTKMHSGETEACTVCKTDVDISEMTEHLESKHARSCDVRVTRFQEDDIDKLLRSDKLKVCVDRRRASGGSVDSSDVSSDESVVCVESVSAPC